MTNKEHMYSDEIIQEIADIIDHTTENDVYYQATQIYLKLEELGVIDND
jgi:hypothetical protein